MVTKRAKAQKVKASHEEAMERKRERGERQQNAWTLPDASLVFLPCLHTHNNKFNKHVNLQEHHDATGHAVQCNY
jgi:hypothetical protein